MNKAVISFRNDDVMTPQPWPVGLDEENRVTSGLGPDDGAYLLGFGPAGEQAITVYAAEALANPESVIGLTPTFSRRDSWFLWNYPVAELRLIDNKNSEA